MERKEDSPVEPSRWYSASEAAPFLDIREATLKNKLRSGDIDGIQRGAKRVWHVKGTEIIKMRKVWNLEVN
ncbi:MAG: hypothetical protein WBD27_17870 [Pyrinomonadaceae bacterium]